MEIPVTPVKMEKAAVTVSVVTPVYQVRPASVEPMGLPVWVDKKDIAVSVVPSDPREKAAPQVRVVNPVKMGPLELLAQWVCAV